jgi:hypothetical protein
MEKHPSKIAAGPDLLPWQGVVMVVCVTLAGLLHEHLRPLQPVVTQVQTAGLRSGISHAAPPSNLLDTVLWITR